MYRFSRKVYSNIHTCDYLCLLNNPTQTVSVNSFEESDFGLKLYVRSGMSDPAHLSFIETVVQYNIVTIVLHYQYHNNK